MFRPAHSRGSLVTFVATKVTKKAVSRNASLPHKALPCKSTKTTGCKISPPCAAQGLYTVNIAMPFLRTGPHRFA